MREVRTQAGPFKVRPHFSNADIEAICADELRASGLYPKTPEPVRIDRFIEKRFSVVPRSEDLLPGVLGYTEFGDSGVLGIVISRSLELETGPTARRRSRTTFAHEAGHGLLHAHLYAVGELQEAFPEMRDTDAPRILCRDDALQVSVGGGYSGRWWEYQANQAMAALLLPRDLVASAIQPFLIERGALGLRILDAARLDTAVRYLAQVFDVNPIVVRLRLGALYETSAEAQMTL